MTKKIIAAALAILSVGMSATPLSAQTTGSSPVVTLPKDNLNIFIIGASLWMPGGQEQVKRHLEDYGCKGIKMENSRSNPWAYWQLRMHEAGTTGNFPKSAIPYSQAMAQKDIDSMTKRMSGKPWDMVLFMGHSTEPIHMVNKVRNVQEDFDLFIAKVKELAPNAQIVPVMTWYKDSVKNTTPEMWDAVQSLYRGVATKYGTKLVPTGMAFKRVYEERPDINIRVGGPDGDGHANALGQYLNVCCIYSVLTGKSPVGLPPEALDLEEGTTDQTMESDQDRQKKMKDSKKGKGGAPHPVQIPPDTARYLQETAWKVCTEEPLSGCKK